MAFQRHKSNAKASSSFQHKKSLGQHFLIDLDCAYQIVEALQNTALPVLEVGPGGGVLTQFLVPKYKNNFYAVDLDDRVAISIPKQFTGIHFIHEDILKVKFEDYINGPFTIIGNFPYNISTEIIFKVIDNRNQVVELVGMFQKEVAKRFASLHGNKVYGVTSVLTQAYYDVTYLFDVQPHQFDPPPKVMSGVLRLVRKQNEAAITNTVLFKKIVKAGFSQRRKVLRNSLRSVSEYPLERIASELLDKRAEQLSVEEWIATANLLAEVLPTEI